MKQEYHTPGGGVDSTTEGSHWMGFASYPIPDGTGFVDRVVIRADGQQNASYQVFVDGSALFTSALTVNASDTVETHIPNQNRYFGGDAPAEVLFSVTTSASAAGTTEATVLTETS